MKPFIIPVFLPHAGCPHRCVFCNQDHITGNSEPTADLSQIRAGVETYLSYKGPGRGRVQISFYGGNFLGLGSRQIDEMLGLAAGFVQGGRIDGIRFSTRPDTIDEKRLVHLRQFPVETIELGVQSMNDRVLKNANRGHSAQDTERAVGLLKQAGYEIGLQMMVGLPGEDAADTMESALRIAGLRPDFVRIYPTLVLKDSPLAELYQRGAYRPLTLDQAVRLVKKAYLEFSRQHIRVIRMGLQPSEALFLDDVLLAGPFHPAFGHLVLSEVFLDRASAAIKMGAVKNKILALKVNPRSSSALRGMKNSNIETLKYNFGLEKVHIITDDAMAPETVELAVP